MQWSTRIVEVPFMFRRSAKLPQKQTILKVVDMPVNLLEPIEQIVEVVMPPVVARTVQRSLDEHWLATSLCSSHVFIFQVLTTSCAFPDQSSKFPCFIFQLFAAA